MVDKEIPSSHISFFLDEYHVLDNFSACSITFEGEVWPTLEHLYQASKFSDGKIVERIRQATSPYEAKRIVYEKGVKEHIDPKWNTCKLEVMGRLIRLKVSQHPYVEEVLLRSGTAPLIEKSDTDYYWGCGKDMTGENHVGKIWMEVRQELFAKH